MHVNEHFIDSLLTNLIGGADIDEDIEKYNDVDPNDEDRIKQILIEVVKPFFQEKNEAYQEMARTTLAYYLTSDKMDFERKFASMLIAFMPPTNPKTFFIWMWEVLFPDRSYNLLNWKEYAESDDLNEPYTITLNPMS